MPPENRADHLFTFALRAGDMLLRNGSPSANVTQALLAVARSNGFANTTVNVTMGQITLSYSPAEGATPVTRVQSVGTAGLDIRTLAVLEHIVEDVVTGDVDVTEGIVRLDALASERGQLRVGKMLGSALVGLGFAWLLGASAPVCLVAGLCAAAIDTLVGATTRGQLPSYYARILAGAVAVAVAATLVANLPVASPGVIIIAAVVTQLAGSSSVGAVQDLLTGWLLTACGRLIESALLTLGLTVGVIAGVTGVSKLGVRLDIETEGAPGSDLWQNALASALIAGGVALLSHARPRHLPALMLLGALGNACFGVACELGLSTFSATAVAAALLGILTVAFARPTHLPTSGFLDITIVPLVPGMALYQGFAAMATQDGSATAHLFDAVGLALAIGSGAVFGQFIASRSLWTARSVQHRVVERQWGEGHLDDRQFAARGLSTPDFRRPFFESEREAPRG